jgi:hypothetical protein
VLFCKVRNWPSCQSRQPVKFELSTRRQPIDFISLLGGADYTVFASSPADFGRFIAAYTEKWAELIKFAGAKIY